MRKIFFLATIILLALTTESHAFWMWTPETNRWVNPKYSVKDTPAKQLAYAQEFHQTKDYDKAIDEFQKLVKYYPRSKEAPEAEFFTGLCMEEQGKLFEAYKGYQKVIDRYPFSERSAEVVERQYKIANKLMDGAGKGLWGSILGASYDVVEVFRTVIKNAPYGPYAAVSQYKIGLYLQGQQLYQEARDEFEKVVNDYPDNEWAKAAQYQIALVDASRSTNAQYDQKVTQTAVEEFKEFVKSNPDAELSANAQKQISGLREKDAENNFVVAQFYEKQKNHKAARIYYETVAKDYRDTSWSKKASRKSEELKKKALP